MWGLGRRGIGTAATTLPYSVRTGGVMLGHRPLVLDLYAGAETLG